VAQGQEFASVNVLTDEAGPVTIQHQICDQSDRREGTIEQLVVYFCGHGVNIRYGEYGCYPTRRTIPKRP